MSSRCKNERRGVENERSVESERALAQRRVTYWKSRGILGLLFFVFASRTCFSNHRVLHLPRGSELKSGQGRFSADAASATA